MTENSLLKRIGWTRLIISLVLLTLLTVAFAKKMDAISLLNDCIRRWGQFGILVLAMVPGIQCGIGLNFGVSLGIIGGLLGSLFAMEINYRLLASGGTGIGPWGILVLALVLGTALAGLIGVAYGFLLNRVKGSEMTVATYIGFSAIAFMNIFWLTMPFQNGALILPLGGEGLRQTIALEGEGGYASTLNQLLAFDIPVPGGKALHIPTGLLCFFGLLCVAIWVFLRSKPGMAMTAAGSNSQFATANGINVNKMRILGTAVSTALGGVGIIIYAQTYGFLQLYNAPMMMGFTCVASILIGGATVRRAGVSHALIGSFLFQGLLALGLPVANEVIEVASLSEVLRLIISNGIILYALTKTGGKKSG